MRFPLQPGVEVRHLGTDSELGRRCAELLERDDWSTLELETQAIGLVLADPGAARSWLEACVAADPVRALELALRAVRYGLRLARVGQGFARVQHLPDTAPTAPPPPPAFWRALRRGAKATRPLRAQLAAVADAHGPTDLRLRAGLAHVLFDDPARWTPADHRAALAVREPEAGALLLLALLRGDREALRSPTWPPPIERLGALDDETLAAAWTWYPAADGDVLLRRHAAVRAARGALPTAFAAITSVRGLETLSRLRPTPELLAHARTLPAQESPAAGALRAALLESWERRLQGVASGLPRLQRADGAGEPEARDVARLRAALRGSDDALVGQLARRATPESLSAFATAHFVQWLQTGASPGRRWMA